MTVALAAEREIAMATERRPTGSGPPADPPRAPEDALLVAVASGDQVALGELFDRLGGRLFGLVKRIVRDPAQSEEVVQEIMLEVWRFAARFDPDRGSASTWVLTMAHRRAIDRVRSEQASRDRTERVGIREQQREFDEVAEEVELQEDRVRVAAALSGLTDLQRQAIQLAYYEGHTYREVAELLDVPLGTIKTRMRDGLHRLRDTMEVTR